MNRKLSTEKAFEVSCKIANEMTDDMSAKMSNLHAYIMSECPENENKTNYLNNVSDMIRVHLIKSIVFSMKQFAVDHALDIDKQLEISKNRVMVAVSDGWNEKIEPRKKRIN